MKNLCWVDFGEECFYQSGLNGFKDISTNICLDCRRFFDIKKYFILEFLENIMEEETEKETGLNNLEF